jgi:tellurite resistance protein TerA
MRDKSSSDSIFEATRYRAEKSRYGGAGAAGFISPQDAASMSGFLDKPGETAIVNPHATGFEDFTIGVAWDVVALEKKPTGWLARLFGAKPRKVQKFADLDLGCLYELENGKKGAIQAFGKNFGALNDEPFIHLSGDERTGVADGHDEVITVSGAHWKDIKRMLIYIYIYSGAESWAQVRPQIQVRVPGEEPMAVGLNAIDEKLVLCAVATLENVRGGIRMTNVMEYYPGHPSMDRAFGYGLDWEDGTKDA